MKFICCILYLYLLICCRVNCSFYFKIGACRHGDRCSRMHNRPTYSQTILLQNLFLNPQHTNTGQSQCMLCVKLQWAMSMSLLNVSIPQTKPELQLWEWKKEWACHLFITMLDWKTIHHRILCSSVFSSQTCMHSHSLQWYRHRDAGDNEIILMPMKIFNVYGAVVVRYAKFTGLFIECSVYQ